MYNGPTHGRVSAELVHEDKSIQDFARYLSRLFRVVWKRGEGNKS